MGCEKANTLIQIILTSYPSTVQDVGTGCRRAYRAGLISVEIIVDSPKTSFCFRGAAWRKGENMSDSGANSNYDNMWVIIAIILIINDTDAPRRPL